MYILIGAVEKIGKQEWFTGKFNQRKLERKIVKRNGEQVGLTVRAK